MAKDKILLHSVSKNKDGETFDVRWNGLLVGTVVVPYNTAAVLDFSTKPGVDYYYIRKAALKLYDEHQRDVVVHMKRKTFSVSKEISNTKPKQPKLLWKKIYNMDKKTIGKFCELKLDDGIGADVVFVKRISSNDAVWAINTLLKTKKYSTVQFTVSQMLSKPVRISNTASKKDITAIIACVMVWNEIKQEKQEQPKPKEITKESDDDFVPKSMEPSHDIDPMILAKVLTLVCSPKQTIDNAKKAAQQKANDQYTCVKLLDKDSKFICNIYPTITAKEHALRRGGRIRDAIYRKLNEREIGD